MQEIDEILEAFQDFYASAIPEDRREDTCIILQSNRKKIYFDIYIMVCLLFVSIVVPVNLAFGDDDNQDPLIWIIIYAWIDLSFLVDIVLTFFTSYTDSITSVEVTDNKKIAMKYISSGWFFFDVLSIIPIDYIIKGFDQSDSTNGADEANINSLLRFAKFSKVYKIVRLTRLAKVFKLLKKKQTLLSKLSEKLKISSGLERLTIFTFFFALFIHVAACLFILLTEFESEIEVTWVFKNGDLQGWDLYYCAVYFVLTTVSTVGFGDIIPGTLGERIYCIALMFIGVSAFTFVSGALSSIISNYD